MNEERKGGNLERNEEPKREQMLTNKSHYRTKFARRLTNIKRFTFSITKMSDNISAENQIPTKI